jgi:amino acid transporter
MFNYYLCSCLTHDQGWLLATGWQGSVIGLSFLAGTIIQGLVVLNDTTYTPQRWHGTLIVIAVVAFCIIFNTSLAKKLPLIEGFILLIHVIGLFAIIVPLWVLSPRNDAKTALLTFNNGGNWPTQGVAFMIGLLTSLGSMMGFDCSVHMCESKASVRNLEFTC